MGYKQKPQGRPVFVHGALNGNPESPMHLLTDDANVAVSRAGPRATHCRRELLLLIKRTTPFAVQPVHQGRSRRERVQKLVRERVHL